MKGVMKILLSLGKINPSTGNFFLKKDLNPVSENH